MAPEAAKSISLSSSCLPLDGRVAIITGGSRGIGRAISVHLHSLGARVVINYASNSTEANKLVSDLNAAPRPPRAVAVQADVSDPLQVKLLFDRAEQEFDSPDNILVNSAGATDSKYPSLANTTVEDWDKTFSVNSRGAFLCCKEGANRVKRCGGGRIIMISTSIVGSLPPGFGAYGASKAAVEAMVKIAAKELKGTKITANCVAPGPIATEFFFQGKTEEMVQRCVDGCPMERLGEPPDVAAVVGFLADDGGEWVNGQVIRVNGCITVLTLSLSLSAIALFPNPAMLCFQSQLSSTINTSCTFLRTRSELEVEITNHKSQTLHLLLQKTISQLSMG